MINYGHVELRIENLLKERNISKNKICKDLDLPRPNFNRYCRNDFQRIDADLLAKLCCDLNCEIQELIVYVD